LIGKQVLLSVDVALLALQDILGLLDEVIDELELVIEASISQIRDLVQFLEPSGDGHAKLSAGHLAVEPAEDLFLDVIHEVIERIGADPQFPAGPLHAAEKLVSIVGIATTVLFDDQQFARRFNALIGRVPTVTCQTLTPPSDHQAPFGRPRVDDPIPVFFAIRTSHLIAMACLLRAAESPNI